MIPRFGLAFIAGAALLGAAADARAPEEIEVTDRRTLAGASLYPREPARPAATRRFTLTLVYFAGGRWAPEAVTAAAARAVEILAQCGVRAERAELVRVDAPRRYHYLDTPVSRALARALQLPKPTVYFVTDTRHRPAFDAEAVGRANSRTRPEMADTVWVAHAARDPGITLAHELIHVLADSGDHTERAGNLMRERTTPGNTDLTRAQCVSLRDMGTRNGLLHRTGTAR